MFFHFFCKNNYFFQLVTFVTEYIVYSGDFCIKNSDSHEKKNYFNKRKAPQSQLTHWPVQLHLLNPESGFFNKEDVVLAADCTAYAYGDFHNRFLRGKKLAIACPKLDSNKEIYLEKIVKMIDVAHINTLTVVMMEVPCCGGLMQIAKMAADKATRKVPVKQIIIGLQGEKRNETWV